MLTVMERFQWFSNEIQSTDARLKQLGMEGEYVVEEIKQMFKESGQECGKELKQFENLVMKAKQGVLGGDVKEKYKSVKRCRYWNRGYCREGTTKCPYFHPPDDCQQHLLEGRCSRQGCGHRHRRKCKYWGTKQGCFRKGQCQYLHSDDSFDFTEIRGQEVGKDVITEDKTFTCENENTSIPTKKSESELYYNVEKGSSEVIANAEKNLSCDLCKYKCQTDNMMKKHVKSKHEGHLTCPICESKFSSADNLFAHGRSLHNLNI